MTNDREDIGGDNVGGDNDNDNDSDLVAGSDADEYQVGYRRPPHHTRFKPGQSGNPRGRPKGARGLKTDLRQALCGQHTIQINGKPLRGNRQELMMLTLATRAASGDLKAQGLLIPLILQLLGATAGEDNAARLSAHDQALLDRMLSHFGEGLPDDPPATPEPRNADDSPGAEED